jgi:hypothetical protein
VGLTPNFARYRPLVLAQTTLRLRLSYKSVNKKHFDIVFLCNGYFTTFILWQIIMHIVVQMTIYCHVFILSFLSYSFDK